MAGQRLHKLQGLRAIAACLVAIDHSITMLVGHGFTSEQITPVAWFIGEQGVATFFVISGFIMWHITGQRVEGAPKFAKKFAVDRIFRIAPVYWLVTLIAVALILSGAWLKGKHVSAIEIAKSVLFIPYGDGVHAMRPVLGQGWTLNYEVGFYALFGLSLLVTRQFRLLAVSIPLLTLAASGIFAGTGWSGADPVTVGQFYASPLLLLFIVGMLIAKLKEHVVAPWVGAYALTIGVVGYAVEALIFHHFINLLAIPLPWRACFWMFDAIVVVLCVFASEARADDRTARPIEYAGDGSYSVYLVHFFGITIVAKLWAVILHWHAPLLFVACACICGFTLGLIFYQVVQRRLDAALKPWAARLSS